MDFLPVREPKVEEKFWAGAAKKAENVLFQFDDCGMSRCLYLQQRVRSRQMFQFIYREGKLIRGSLLDLRICQRPKSLTRELGKGPLWGIVVSRKTDLRATRRNQWKRRIREAFKQYQVKIQSDIAILIQSKKQEDVPSYKMIVFELEKLLSKAGILKWILTHPFFLNRPCCLQSGGIENSFHRCLALSAVSIPAVLITRKKPWIEKEFFLDCGFH